MSRQTRKRKRAREQSNDDICAVNSNSQSHDYETGNFDGRETETTGKLTSCHTSGNTSKLKNVASTSRSGLTDKGSDANSTDYEHDEHVNQCQWNHLPHTILAQIYSYLDPIHQRRASITCKQWRECYFSPNLWRDVQLCRTSASEPWKGAEFVLERCGKYIRNLQVVTFTRSMWDLWVEPLLDLDSLERGTKTMNIISENLSGITSLLGVIHCNCRSLDRLQLKMPQGLASDPNYDFIMKSMEIPSMWEQIAGIVKNSPALKRLQLDHIVDIIGCEDRLQHVAQTCGNSLSTLQCCVSFEDLRPPKTCTNSFKIMNRLTNLRLNLPFISDELLLSLSSAQHCPMKVIEILIVGEPAEERIVDSIILTNDAWTAMTSHSTALQVGVLCHYDTRSRALTKVLELSKIPLKWLKIISVSKIQEEVFRCLQSNFTQSLQRLDCLNIYDDEMIQLSRAYSYTNPVVMTIWRCSNLTKLNIKGFEVTSNDILGIARMGTRLRGNSLEVFGIQESCIVYEAPVNTRDELLAEVRKCLTQDWEPLDGVEARLIRWEAWEKLPANNWGSGPLYL